jgi:hypothetical protein
VYEDFVVHEMRFKSSSWNLCVDFDQVCGLSDLSGQRCGVHTWSPTYIYPKAQVGGRTDSRSVVQFLNLFV